MRTAKRQSVLVPTTLALIFGIVIGAVGITIIQQPAASHPAPGAMASTSGKRAPSDQPVNEARAAAGAIERPEAGNEPAEPQVAPGVAPEPQPQAEEEQKPAKQPSAWDLLSPEQKEAERWKEVRRVTGKPALSDVGAREAYFKLPFSIKLQMEYALTKDERLETIIELHRALAKSEFLKKLLATEVPWRDVFSEEEIEKIAAKVRGDNFAQTTDESLFYLGRMDKQDALSLIQQAISSPLLEQMIRHLELARDLEIRRLLHVMESRTSSAKFDMFADTQPPPATIWPMLVDNAFEDYPRS